MNMDKIDKIDVLFITICLGYLYGYYKIYYWFS
jgi:hypothetical protein